jgi:hypothetical protein
METLLQLLVSAFTAQAMRAVVGLDDPSGDGLPPNYALLPAQVPLFLSRRTSHVDDAILFVGGAWADRLAARIESAHDTAATLEVSLNYVVINEPGIAITGSVAQRHMAVRTLGLRTPAPLLTRQKEPYTTHPPTSTCDRASRP